MKINCVGGVNIVFFSKNQTSRITTELRERTIRRVFR